MKKLILVSGKARSGKDSFCKYLTQDLDNFQWLDMTGGLKEVVAKMFGISLGQLEVVKDVAGFCEASPRGKSGNIETKRYTARHFLQFIGNDIAPPLLGKYHWAMERQHKMFSVDREINILSGVRQLKEIEYFKKMNPDKEVIVVKLVRLANGVEYSPINKADKSHSTETEVDLIEADYTYRCENLEEVEKASIDFLSKLNE